MSEKNTIVKLAVDAYKGNPTGQYSKDDSMKVLREALVELNGGTKLDYKKMRAGASNGLFEIIEEILQKTIVEGLPTDNFFNQFVDYKNLDLGDKNTFYVEDNSLFTVADVTEGNQTIRRQRLNAGSTVTVDTSLKAVKIYEELNRVLAGRVDLNEMIAKVALSFSRKRTNDIYTAWANIFTSLPATFGVSGSYSESGLLTLIDHVEAATGQKATIVGTRNALRNITMSTVSEQTKADINAMGYIGNFNGTACMAIPQVHEVNTYNFKLSDKDIFVVPADTKPIKFVTEGESVILPGDAMNNADLTQEYLACERYGIAVMIATMFGIYRLP